jgi:hypothetical protein
MRSEGITGAFCGARRCPGSGVFPVPEVSPLRKGALKGARKKRL